MMIRLLLSLLLAITPANADFGAGNNLQGFWQTALQEAAEITFVASVSDNSIEGNTCTITAPSRAVGDVIVVIGGGSEATGSPAGTSSSYITLLSPQAGGSAGEEYTAWAGYRVATNDANDNFTSIDPGGAATACAYVMMVFRGVDTTTPIDAVTTSIQRLDDTTPAATDIVTLSDGAAVVVGAVFGVDAASATAVGAFPNPCNTNTDDDQGNDTQDVMTGMSWCLDAVAGTFDPDATSEWSLGATDDGFVVTIALRPSGSGAADPVQVTFITQSQNTTGSASINFTNIVFGPPYASRWIIVSYYSGENNPTSVAMTIGGVSATKSVSVSSTNTPEQGHLALFIAAVPTGGSGTIAITNSGSLFAVIGVWMVTGYTSTTATATATDNTDTSEAYSGSLTIPSGGFGIGMSADESSGGGAITCTWTNLTESFDSSGFGGGGYAHSGAATQSAGAATRTCTWAGDTIRNRGGLVLGAWN